VIGFDCLYLRWAIFVSPARDLQLFKIAGW